MTRKSLESQQPQDADRTSEDVIREWVARFATNCGQPLSEARVLLWIDELSDIEPGLLERAFRAVMRCHTFNNIPQIGDIRAQIDQADCVAGAERAERDWRALLDYVRKWGWGDGPGGLFRGAPPLLPLIEYAADAAGGIPDLVKRCSDEERVWQKKDFLAAHQRGQQSERLHELPSTREDRELLRELSSISKDNRDVKPAKSLSAPGHSSSLPETADPTPASAEDLREVQGEFHQLKEELRPVASTAPPVGAELTDREWQARKARQLRAITEALPTWREDHQRKIHLYIQLRTEGFPERRIAQQLFPGSPRKDQLYLLKKFANIHREEIDACAGAPLPASASVGEERCCAD